MSTDNQDDIRVGEDEDVVRAIKTIDYYAEYGCVWQNKKQAQGLLGSALRVSAAYDAKCIEVEQLQKALRRVVRAMALWGSWEDGIPEMNDNVHGSVWYAFDSACYLLGLDCSSINTFQEIQRALRGPGPVGEGRSPTMPCE